MKFSILWLLVGGGIGFGLALLVTPGVEPGLGSTLRADLESARRRIEELEAEVASLKTTSTSPEHAIPRWRDEMEAKLTREGETDQDLRQLAHKLALSENALADAIIGLNNVDAERLLVLNWKWRVSALERALGEPLPPAVLSRIRQACLEAWRGYRQKMRTEWLEGLRAARTLEDRAALEQARSASIGDLASRLAFAARKALADEGMDRRWVTVATYL